MTDVVGDQTASAELEQKGINVIRGLSMDAPHAAKSGHQGTAMALAPLAHALFTRVLNYDAADPSWPDRDRFVLSAGHASILHYAMLHLTGQGLELEDLRQFRQFGSKTPGHPEADHTDGIEVTTGPLGQGLANAVGMAMTERYLRTTYGEELCDHFTYVIAGDGCLSEGISHEAASLAGHQGLGRLIAVYDDNHITIDGPTELALSDDAPARFAAYGWDVDNIGEVANDVDALTAALERAKDRTDRPTLIVLRSHIGYPSPTLTDHHSAHGLAFGDEEITATKQEMGIPDEPFWVPEDVLDMYRAAGSRGGARRAAWSERLAASPHRDAWESAWAATPRFDLDAVAGGFTRGDSVATRKASQSCVSAISDNNPGFIGGSADLTGNTGTKVSDDAQGPTSGAGRQVYFGVREHAMGSALVGAAKHGGVVPIGGTFLVFADYMRPAVRLAAMSHAKCVFVWTHDSLGVGEDGPTHQPVEQIMSLRAIPGLRVIRPGDAIETAGAWKLAMDADGPSAMILSRQNLPVLAHTDAVKVAAGAYALNDVAAPSLNLIGTGSELALCVDAAERLGGDGIATKVISMPCWEAFEARSPAERAAVLDRSVPTISVEAGVSLGWDRYADVCIGIDRFGASGPGGQVLDRLGMNVDNITTAAKELLSTTSTTSKE
ncbi:MAG: transketolase [Actinomycetota bacterium]